MAGMAKPSVRERLLDAAVEAVRQRGYNGCGVQDITDAAGVPKGSFYNHFDSKEALGAAIVEQYWQRGACSSLCVLSDESLPPIERLRRYFDMLAANMADRDYKCGCLIGNLSAELADQSRLVCDRLSAIYAGWTRSIETCLREAQRAGEIATGRDPAVLAAFLVNAWEGTVLRAKVDKEGTAYRQFQEIVFGVLLG
ncbi:MAG: TetR family transcriptional regulator C-terminal domain-containing protein [Alphaproteobacteria bacterium]|nr:TetR family transcriptional regulator C-terminal domain-containing protein [Alphaproteobacteria bacterium]